MIIDQASLFMVKSQQIIFCTVIHLNKFLKFVNIHY